MKSPHQYNTRSGLRNNHSNLEKLDELFFPRGRGCYTISFLPSYSLSSAVLVTPLVTLKVIFSGCLVLADLADP